jgi:hypothetical protein
MRRVVPPSPARPLVVLGLALAAGAAMFLLAGSPVGAFDRYSIDGVSGNCADCHGDFRDAAYVSAHDGKAWNTSLHDGHRTTMLNGDCDVCHGANRFPVLLNSSKGGTGFAAISCDGCHGRAETAAAGAVKGSGLRQHHYRNGVTLCGNSGCHTDANPATFAVVGESVKPPYYFTPDTAHPAKPTDPCNVNGSESAVAPPLGLDNDGNNLYDAGDPNCGTTDVGDNPFLDFALSGAYPNPSAGKLRVAFTLPGGQPAVLEAFDVTGRRIAVREVGSLGAGRHVVELASGKPIVAGVYVLRLTQGGRSLTTKVAVMR